MALILYVISSISLYIINNKAVHSFSIELSYIQSFIQGIENEVDELEKPTAYRISLKGNEYELKNNGNKFVSKKRYTKYFIVKLPVQEFSYLYEIKVDIGEKQYRIKKKSLSRYFLINQTDENVLLVSNQSFNNKPSKIFIFNDIITWKGDNKVFIGGIISNLWLLPIFILFFLCWNFKSRTYNVLLNITNKINNSSILNRIESLLSLTLLKRLIFSIWLLLFVIIFYSFFSNYDVTHEGYFFYNHQQGFKEATNVSGVNLITYPLGFLFAHTLIGYRVSNLFLIIVIAVFYAVSIKKFMIPEEINNDAYCIIINFINISAIGFFVLMPVLDYSAFNTLAAVGWVSSIMQFLYYNEKDIKSNFKYVFLLLIGFFIFLAIISRFTFGIPLLFITFALFIFFKKYYSIKIISNFIIVLLPIIIISLIIYFYLDKKTISELIVWIDFYSHNNRFDNSSSSDVTYLIVKYMKSIKNFIIFSLKNVFIYLSIYLLLKTILIKYFNCNNKNNVLKFIKYLIIVIFMIINFISLLEPYFHNEYKHFWGFSNFRIVLAVFFILIVYNLVKWKSNSSKKNILLFLLILIGLSNSVGSIDDFINMASLSIVLPAGFIICLFYSNKNSFKAEKIYLFLLTFFLAINVGFCTIYEQIIYAKRNSNWSYQTHLSKYSPYLKYIKIEKDLAMHIDKLWQLLHEIDFDFNRDRIYAFGDVPGLLSAVGAKAYGESWVFIESYITNDYKSSWNRSLTAVKLDKNSDTRYIYILSTNILEIPEPIMKYLNDILKPRISIPEKYNLGKGVYHWYNKNVVYDITLEGPFEIIGNDY